MGTPVGLEKRDLDRDAAVRDRLGLEAHGLVEPGSIVTSAGLSMRMSGRAGRASTRTVTGKSSAFETRIGTTVLLLVTRTSFRSI